MLNIPVSIEICFELVRFVHLFSDVKLSDILRLVGCRAQIHSDWGPYIALEKIKKNVFIRAGIGTCWSGIGFFFFFRTYFISFYFFTV